MMLSHQKLIQSLAVAVMLLAPTAASAQPRHPRYLHARSDLRRAYLFMRVHEEPNVERDLNIAADYVVGAIREIDNAARWDRRDIDDNPPVDIHLGRGSRFREIIRLLESARADIDREEDNPMGHALETALGDFSQLYSESTGFLLQVFLADLDGLQPLAGVDDVLDLVAGLRGLDQRQPILAGQVAGLGHDLDDVAIAQRIAQRHDAAVDLGAHAGLADIGVNGVGEIDGGGVARQHDHLAARREGVDLLRVKVHLEGGHELGGVLHVVLPLDQMAQPGDALIVGRGPLLAFLVFPVRRDALLGDAVHFLGADLHFEVLAVRPHHGGMQRLVEIGAGDGDEVLDAAGNGPPLVVDHAQGGVAVLHRVGDDTQRHQVVDLLDGDFLALDLLIDGIRPLEAAFHARGNAFAAQLALDGGADLVQEFFVGVALRFDGLGDLREGFRIQMEEGEVFQLAAHFAHAEAVRDGGVDFDGLGGHVRPALGAQVPERAHVVQAVRQLHDDDADVVDHGQQHFAKALGLPFFRVEDVQLAELGDAIHAARHLVAEALADFVGRHAGVFHQIVQQSGLDGHQIHAHAGQDVGHL